MKQIPLRNRAGEVVAHALVDDGDFEWLSQWRWYKHHKGYVQRTEGRRTIRIHRQIMNFPASQVDHWDGNRLNNQRANLRRVTNAQNGQNRRGGRGTSRYRGVNWYAPLRKWCARVRLDGKLHHLGYFEDEREADAVARAFRSEHMPYSQEASVGP